MSTNRIWVEITVTVDLPAGDGPRREWGSNAYRALESDPNITHVGVATGTDNQAVFTGVVHTDYHHEAVSTIGTTVEAFLEDTLDVALLNVLRSVSTSSLNPEPPTLEPEID